jgi:peptidoglycan-N-acetylglucosamine deacetylase
MSTFVTPADTAGVRELFQAAEDGDSDCVQRLVLTGVRVNAQDTAGDTALHRAVRRGQAQTAACLLALGASHAVANCDGKRPLSLTHTHLVGLHAIRQRYHRYRTDADNFAAPAASARWAAQLEERGIVRLCGLIDPATLARMQAGVQQFVGSLGRKLAQGTGVYRHYDEEEHYWANDRASVCNNAFKYAADLVAFCGREEMLALARLYLGKPALIQRGVAMRYRPSPSSDNDMFGWHHDMEDKRLKIMILLSDVGPEDQTMSYVLGSHRLFHPLPMFLKNQCSLDYCRRHLGEIEIFDTIGKAGDVFLFDSNGAHRGNRRPSAAVRDALFVEYTTDPSDLWGADIPVDAFESLPAHALEPFARLLAADKKWQRPSMRRLPAWVENLEKVTSWLAPLTPRLDPVGGLATRPVCIRRLVPTVGDSVLLTFDDGPDDQVTPEVLQRLRAYGARAVFFVTGRAALRSPRLLRRIVEEGHLLGNHTYSHPQHVPPLQEYEREVLRCQAVVGALAGAQPQLFRPPYGVLGGNGDLIAAPCSAGLQTVLWSAECRDWQERPLQKLRAVAIALAGRIRAGDIVLLHDNQPQVLTVLDILLPALQTRRLNLERGASFLGMWCAGGAVVSEHAA